MSSPYLVLKVKVGIGGNYHNKEGTVPPKSNIHVEKTLCTSKLILNLIIAIVFFTLSSEIQESPSPSLLCSHREGVSCDQRLLLEGPDQEALRDAGEWE